MRPTIVLIHGSGHRAVVWDAVRAALQTPSIAVDLPGRATRPADLGESSNATWARSVVADVEATTEGPLVVVGHSAAGAIVPPVAAAFGRRVQHLVFVAGLIARHDALVVDSFHPDRKEAMIEALGWLRERWRGHSYVFEGDTAPAGFEALFDLDQLTRLDSMVAMVEPISWTGVPDDLARTWVRCLRDRIQPREFQARLAENCAADEVVDLDCGHTPALSRPAELAAQLDRIASRYEA